MIRKLENGVATYFGNGRLGNQLGGYALLYALKKIVNIR